MTQQDLFCFGSEIPNAFPACEVGLAEIDLLQFEPVLCDVTF